MGGRCFYGCQRLSAGMDPATSLDTSYMWWWKQLLCVCEREEARASVFIKISIFSFDSRCGFASALG